jgi:putative membrane protein
MLHLAGSLSGHMAQHIVLMNVLAPLLVLACRRSLMPGLASRLARPGTLALATALQIALFWGWHAPGVFAAATASTAGQAFMQLTLFLAALAFWGAVVLVAGRRGWRAIAALLVTSKLFCLFGVLLAFAPRVLHAAAGPGHGQLLPDQQLAGLIMLVACPATYLLAGIVIAIEWFDAIDRDVPVPASPGAAEPGR